MAIFEAFEDPLWKILLVIFCLFVCFIRCLTPPGHSECITAALQPVKYLQKYSREQTIESASDEMTYKLVKFHGTKEG